MIFYIKQKVFSFGDKFFIKDAYGNNCFFAQGRVFSLGKKLYLFDASGAEIAFIKQRLLSFLPKFEIYMQQNLLMTVVKRFSIRPKYDILGAGWQVSGDLWAHEYTISAEGYPLAHISKAWFTWGDSYQIDVPDPHNVIPVLATILAIDAAMASQSNS